MAWLSFLDPVLNVIFWPLLQLPPFWGIVLVSFVISLLITLIYKWTTDQNLMKQLKDEIKTFQKQAKELRSNPEEAMKVQKRAMETNMKYMMHSLKPTLFTFIPIILIFGWLQANIAFQPVLPNQEFSVEMLFDGDGRNVELAVFPEGLKILNGNLQKVAANKVSYALTGAEGRYSLEFSVFGENKTREELYKKEVLITNKWDYEEPVKAINKNGVKSIIVGNAKTVILDLFGWKIGWLGGYILFSIVFSLVQRRIFKIY